MKKKNCICEFSSQRSMALLTNFRRAIANQSRISAQKAFKEAVESPVPRFWVSEARATRVITALINGIDLTEGMHSEKRKMYLDIYAGVIEEKKNNPQKPIGDIVFDIVNSPAPRSYMKWQTAGKIIRASRKNASLNSTKSLK